MAKSTIASTNIDFLRWKHGTHKALQERLSAAFNWKQLSDAALANSEVSGYQATSIESELGLPSGWVSRDNLAFTALSKDDHALVSAMLTLGPEAKKAIAGLVAVIAKEAQQGVQADVHEKP